MATITDSSTSSGPGRPLWQAPAFVLGVAALLFVGMARPTLGNPVGRRLDRDLAAIREVLNQGNADLDEVARRAGTALERARRSAPDRAGEAHYLLGSALLRKADRASSQNAPSLLRAARSHLEEAVRQGISEGERPHLDYRLLKVRSLMGDDPKLVLERLKALEPAREDQADYYALLTRVYLDQTPPNLTAALEANNKLRSSEATEDVLVEARLRGGELNLRLRRFAEARKDLEKVGTQAPPALRQRALLYKARSFHEEGSNWQSAANAWLQALTEGGETWPERPLALYHLGLSYRQFTPSADREAERAWIECVRVSHGDEGPAAAISLAEMLVSSPEPNRAVEFLAKALRDIRTPDDWKNTLIDLAGTRARIERIALVLRQAGQFEMALRLATSYQKLAPAAAAQLGAEAANGWARQRREEAARLPAEQRKPEDEKATLDLFRQAGDGYLQAATQAADPDEAFWLAAACYLDARDLQKHMDALKKCLEVTAKTERKAEGWYLLGEALRRQGQEVEGDDGYRKAQEAQAEEAYRNCIQLQNAKEKVAPFPSRARYQLAMLMMARGDLDKAESTLEQNLTRLRFDPDPETQEKTLFALGRLFYQRRNYRMAATRLEELFLKETRAQQAGGVGLLRARLLLAASYRQQATQERQNELLADAGDPGRREVYQSEHRRFLKKAAKEYNELGQILKKPEARGQLTPREEAQVPFLEAECWFDHGGENRDYSEAIAYYSLLAQQHTGTVDGLTALGGLVRCYSARQEPAKVQDYLTKIRESLKNMDESVRGPWEEWLTIVSKPMTTNP